MDIFTQQMQQQQVQQAIDIATSHSQQAVELANMLHQQASITNGTHKQFLPTPPAAFILHDEGLTEEFDVINAEIEAHLNAPAGTVDTSSFDYAVEEMQNAHRQRAADMERHYYLAAKNIKQGLTVEEVSELERLTESIFG